MKKILVIILCFSFFEIFAQSNLVPINRDILWDVDKANKSINKHTSVKPYIYSKIKDTLNRFKKDTAEYSLIQNISKGNLFEYEKNHFYINLNPDIDLSKTNASHFQTEYGVRLTANFKKKLSLWVKLNQGLGNYAPYIDSVVTNNGIIIGKGLAKPLGANYRYNNNEFVISYDLNSIFNFQLGRSNHFWGDGYRSFYLSDNSRNFPYFKITADIWHVKYTAMWGSFNNLLNSDVNGYQNLHGVFNHLDWNISKKINAGIFQSVTWSQFDTLPSGQVINRGWDPQYANPLIFFRPVEYSLGSPDNVIVGADAKFNINKKNQIYFQMALDELVVENIREDFKKFIGLKSDTAIVNWWGNKYALQLGWKSYDIFDIEGLDIQQEFNTARPYIYTHRSDGQGYTNSGQALAHPFGANLHESVTFFRYRNKKLMAELKILVAAYGADSTSVSYGGNILKSYEDVANIGSPVNQYGVRTLQGLKTNLYYQDLKVVYFINPKSHLRAEALISHRIQSTQFGKSDNLYLTLGIKTTLGNSYTDF